MSTLKVNRIEPRTGDTIEIVGLDIPEPPETPVKAWVNFNGASTVVIRDSMNVSSITDNGVGDYTVNFATPMPDANYGFSLSGSFSGSGNILQALEQENRHLPTNSSIRILNKQANGQGTQFDAQIVCVSIFR